MSDHRPPLSSEWLRATELSAKPSVRVFLSYAISDDKEFGFIDPFVTKLKSIVKIKSGRRVEIFLDRSSLGWGDRWRQDIWESVTEATVFLPMVTATYLERTFCREEFVTFLSKARSLGVTELILPVLPFSSALIVGSSHDLIAAYVGETQSICLEEGLLAGYDSAPWLRLMHSAAVKFLDAVEQAEMKLASVQAADDVSLSSIEELRIFATSQIQAARKSASSTTQALEVLSASLSTALGDAKKSPSQRGAELASSIQLPASRLSLDSSALLQATQDADQALLLLERVSNTSEATDDREYDDPIAQADLVYLRDLAGSLGVLNQILEQLAPLERSSPSLRRVSLQIREGVTNLRDSATIILGWPEKGEVGERDEKSS